MITQNTHASHAQSNISKFFILVILLFITISCGYDEEDTSPSQFKDVSASVNKDKKIKINLINPSYGK